MRYFLALAVLVGLLVGGCGSDDESADSQSPPKKIELRSDVEEFTKFRKGIAAIHGTVSPPDATVEVNGVTADVQAGRWSARVRLEKLGENTVEVIATKPGFARGSIKTVLVRARSARELALRRDRRRRERAAARRRREAAAARAAAARVGVPNLVGERLDVARETLRDRRLRAKIIGGGTFGVIAESNWTVCETRPGTGTRVKPRTRVRLIVDRAC